MASGRLSKVKGKVLDIPNPPTIGTATAAGSQSVAVSFTADSSGAGGPTFSYTVTSSPGSITATGTSSPITVTGLTNGTAYTFTVKATNPTGSSSSTAASNSVTPFTVIGTTGQGGGIIFYDAGSTLSWGRYLEVATSSTSPAWSDTTSSWWEGGNTSAGTSEAIGTGMANSLAMLAIDSTANRAATKCRSYAGGGYSSTTTGWYLPSIDELYTLYTQRAVIGSYVGDWYWSSSDTGNRFDAKFVNFGTGESSQHSKSNTTLYARAIRKY
jgi:hypothetical protein